MSAERAPRFFSFDERELIARTCEAAPHEACGLIFAARDATWPHDSKTFVASQTHNANREPERGFSIDPLDWLSHEEAAARLGLEVRGFWHSHPNSSPALSMADAQTIAGLGPAACRWIFAIVGLGPGGRLVLEVHESLAAS